MKDACWTYSSIIPGLLPWQSYALAFVIGILGVRFPIPALVALAVLYLADRTLRERACRLPVLVFVCCAAFGFGYAVQRTPDLPASVPGWVAARTPALVHGVVDRVESRPGNRQRIVLRDVVCEVDGESYVLPGRMAWNQRRPEYRPAPGQTVDVRMRIVPVKSFGNPGSWDYEWYWQRQGVFWRSWVLGREGPDWGERPLGFFWDIKTSLRRAVAGHVPDTQGGAMVLALTTGDRSALDSKTMEATRSAGLVHTLALSGLHVGFVAAMGLGLAWLAGWMYPPLLLSVPRPRLAVLLAAPLVLGYAWLGQPSASLIRAAVMFAFWGFLLLQGRGRVLMDGLFFALLVIVFISPLSVFDLSLQMSIAAVAGIGVMYPHFRSLFSLTGSWYRRLLGWAVGLLAVSLCANIALMPLVSWHFGTLSPNILLNLVWLPVIGFVVMPLGLFGMVLGVAGWTAPLGGMLLGWSAGAMDVLLSLLFAVQADGLTPVFAVLRPLWPEMAGFVLLLVTVVSVWRSGRRVPWELGAIGFVLLVSPHVFVMVQDSRDEVRLTMLDVGLGQALVVSTPGGHRWLVDGGGGSKHFDLGEAVVAPWLSLGRPPRLDGAIMSHPDVDHSHGLPFVLDRFDVGTFYTNGQLPGGRTGKRLRAVMAAKGIVPVALVAGDTISLTGGATMDVIHPAGEFRSTRSNERSLVISLNSGGRSLAMLTGDVEAKGIDALLAGGADLRADVLTLPHHGSRSSLSPELYEAVSPGIALCSNGYLNRYGFPHVDVVKGVAASVLSTSEYGMVTVTWPVGGEPFVQSNQP